MGVHCRKWSTLPDGRPVHAYTITNDLGLSMQAVTWGCAITALTARDRHGAPADIVLGFDELGPYLEQQAYFGAVIGRYANRIADARFSLDGTAYELVPNEGRNQLHGGRRGFDKQLWSAEDVTRREGYGVLFSRVSPDGEEGFPGTVDVRVQYLVTRRDELIVDYMARTDRPTVVNLTQHSYFNLSGSSTDVLDHALTIDADAFTPVTADLLPTGEIVPVAGTPFDFREPRRIGLQMTESDEQLRRANGFDHNWVLRGSEGHLRRAARLVDPVSGRVLEVWTSAPGVQFYTGNKLDARHAGLCLETQRFPDAPNHRNFPSAVLRPDAPFRSRTVYKFSVSG